MTTPPGLDYYGEFAKIAPALATLDDVRTRMYPPDGTLCWVLPADVLPGASRCYGLPVYRADVPCPMLGLAPPGSTV